MSYRKYFPRYPRGHPIWQFFKKGEIYGTAFCNICDQAVCRGERTNTTNVIYHLRRHHPDEYKEFERQKFEQFNPPKSGVIEDLGNNDSDIFDVQSVASNDEYYDVDDIPSDAETHLDLSKPSQVAPQESNLQPDDSVIVEGVNYDNITATNDQAGTSLDNESESLTNLCNYEEMSEVELRRQVMISVIKRNNAETLKFQTEAQLAHSRITIQNERDVAIGNFFTSITGFSFLNSFRRS